jgi:endonuclease/exonuclease/phosphatase (EEP) superfamily protein YafD
MSHPPQQRLRQALKTIDWRTVLTWVARPMFIPILIGSLLAYGGQWHQILELATHFRLQYLLVGLFSLVLYGLAKRRVEILLCLFCLGLNGIEVLPWYFPAAAQPEAQQPLRVMVSNVLTSNQRYEDFIRYVKQEQPAVLVVMEIDEAWQKQLRGLKQILPYKIEIPSTDNFGIAIFSKYRLEQPKTMNWGAGGYVVPSLTATITIGKTPLTLIATHPLPPLKPDYFMFRNQQMRELADYVNRLENSAIVMGDLNMSMWSPYFREFMQATKLHSSRQGFGPQPSWPVDSPLLQIPIDHCLVSPKIRVVNNRIGQDIGSDHYPVIADLAI